MGINLTPNLGINKVNFCSTESAKPRQLGQTPPDSFVKESPEAKYARKLERIFPNGELHQIYNEMCDNIGLDYRPNLKLTVPVKQNTGGGYTFHNNTITISLEDSLDSDTKLYAIKDGVKFLEMDETGIPMITAKRIADYIANSPQAANNVGVDKIVTEPASDEEIKKLFIQKLYHEVVHAKQHMIMRQTEGIGSKNIIKAWHTKGNPPEILVNMASEKLYKNSFWADKKDTAIYPQDSEMGQYALKCLDAAKNYQPVESAEYKTNFLEVDAFKRANDYIIEHYGEWS